MKPLARITLIKLQKSSKPSPQGEGNAIVTLE